MLENNRSGYFTDYWALGCIIYELYVGKPPFHAETGYQVFTLVLEHEPIFPKNFDPDAKDLIKLLLCKDYNLRQENVEAMGGLLNHPFF